MYEIVFYEDKNGNSDVEQLIDDLTARAFKNKDARIQLDQMEIALDRLEQLGPLYFHIFERRRERHQEMRSRRQNFVKRIG